MKRLMKCLFTSAWNMYDYYIQGISENLLSEIH